MGIVLKWLTEGANRNPSVPNCFLCRESSESQVCKAGWLKEENTTVLPLLHDERQKRRNQKRNRRSPGQRQKRYEKGARSGASLCIAGHSVAWPLKQSPPPPKKKKTKPPCCNSPFCTCRPEEIICQTTRVFWHLPSTAPHSHPSCKRRKRK